MIPETWLPTVTFTTGFKVPVAVTTCVNSPRSTAAVWYCGPSLLPCLRCQAAPAMPPMTIKETTAHFQPPPLLFAAIVLLANCTQRDALAPHNLRVFSDPSTHFQFE